MKRALRKVPPLFWAAGAVHSMGSTVFGPTWLRWQIDRSVAAGEPIRIVVGSGLVYEPKWIPTNWQYLNLLDEQHWIAAFRDHRIDTIMAEHVWEHLAPEDGRDSADRCFRYLRAGGRLRIAVPDANHPDPDYIEFGRIGGSGPGAFDHKAFYTYQTLGDMLRSVGFEVDLLEYYDAEGSFHANQWNPDDGRIHRCKGWTETLPNGRVMDYTSLIVDGRKPA